jgi:hypothetical protein
MPSVNSKLTEREIMNRSKIVIVLLLLFVLATVGMAGVIDPQLENQIRAGNKTDYHKVIAMMTQQADIYTLDQSLLSSRATLAERNNQVITALQEVATRTQAGINPTLQQLQSQGQIKNYKNVWLANMIIIEATEAAIRELAAKPEIAVIYSDLPIKNIQPVEMKPVQPDHLITSHEIGLERIHVTEAWAAGYTGNGRVVANMDTGVDGDHLALVDRWRGTHGGTAANSWYDPYTTGWTYPQDSGSHGTHTMGTICGRTAAGDTIGVAIDALWIAAAAIDRGDGISGTIADAILSFQWFTDPDGNPATQDNPDAVGNSWGIPDGYGYPNCDQSFWVAIDNCEAAGTVVIFSAGNEGSSGLRSPADRATTLYNCFSVGAVDGSDPNLPIAYFSALGPSECATGQLAIKPEVVAPGVSVRSSVPGNSYASYSGTSMASPHVTGSIALIRQANPNIPVNTIKEILIQTSQDLGTAGEDNTYGNGVINVYQACLMAGGFGNVDGYIRDIANSNPIPGKIEVVGTSIQVNANSSGYYIMGLPDTTLTLKGSYFGYLPTTHVVTVIANDTVSQDFYLTQAPTAILGGTVSIQGGGVVPNAIVRILDTPLAPDTTNASGIYQFAAVPIGSTYKVQVTAIGYSKGLDSIQVVAGTNTLNFTLWPAESFELNNGGYVGDGVWEWGTPTYGPLTAYSGAKCWGTVLASTYPDNADDTLKSQQVYISSPNASLEFYHWFAFENNYDGGNVRVSTDGGVSWNIIEPIGGYPDNQIIGLDDEPGYTSNSGDWVHAEFDLSAYYGHNIIISWRMGSDGSLYYAGWYIDDVVIKGAQPPEPPALQWSPVSYNVSTSIGGLEVRNLTLTNNGNGPLYYSLSSTIYNSLRPVINPDATIPIGLLAIDNTKSESKAEPYYPPVINGHGGPDIYGHFWKDSDEMGGPSYSWVDISSVGTRDTLTDDSYRGPFNIGFTFPYFDSAYTSLYIGSNGFLTFGAGSSSTGNTNLPNSNTPNNLIAIWWDDINPGAGGQIYHYFDSANNRFIVSYVNVPNYYYGGALNFQAILYPNGKITFQYGTMDYGTDPDTLHGATIGIENYNGTDGLQVVYNANYMHDNLAIDISKGWLSVTPRSGTVAPLSNTNAIVTFDGSALLAGTYTGNINLQSNDPTNPNVNIPVTFNVGSGGTPNLVITPVSISDSLATDSTAIKTIKAKNTGTGTLAITYSTASAWLQFLGGSQYIAPGDSLLTQVTINSAGLAPGIYNGGIHYVCNDPDTPSGDILATLKVFEPNIGVAPTAIVDTLQQGETTIRDLAINNSARGKLDYTVTFSVVNGLRIGRAFEQPIGAPTRVKGSTETKKLDIVEPYYPPIIANQGGPDAFGYRWLDSNEPGGPVFSWKDISVIGTPIDSLSDDENVGPLPIGFAFNYYGNDFNSFYFCSNGFMSFSSTSTAYSNLSIPNVNAPLNMLAPFWDDLYFPNGGNAYYYSNNTDSLIVSWVDVPHIGSGGPYSFQVIILQNGRIVFQYQTINQPDSSATIGMQNGNGAIGLQVVYNAHYVTSGMAIEIRPSWLLVSPLSGRVGSNGSDTLDVSLDASSLVQGTYTGQINIASNDIDTPNITVPVTLFVGASQAASINLNTSSIVDTVVSGGTSDYQLLISNSGVIDLNYQITDNQPWIGETPTSGAVPPSLTDSVTITFSAASLTPGSYTGIVTVTSNDPIRSTIQIPVTLVVIEGISCDYMLGDINSDDQRLGGDVTFGVRFFKGLGTPPPDSCYMDSTGAYIYVAGDVNGNCEFRGSDITRLVAYFKGAAALSYCHFFPPPVLREVSKAANLQD